MKDESHGCTQEVTRGRFRERATAMSNAPYATSSTRQLRPTSSSRPAPSGKPNKFPDFETFRETNLEGIRITFLSTEGELNPVGILASEHAVRMFVPDDEETVAEFTTRLNRDAREMRAIR